MKYSWDCHQIQNSSQENNPKLQLSLIKRAEGITAFPSLISSTRETREFLPLPYPTDKETEKSAKNPKIFFLLQEQTCTQSQEKQGIVKMRCAKNVPALPTLEAFLGRAGISQIQRFDLGIVLLPGPVGKMGREQHIQDPLKVSLPRFTTGKKIETQLSLKPLFKADFQELRHKSLVLSSRGILRKSELQRHHQGWETGIATLKTQGCETGIATLKTEPGLHQLCQESGAGKKIPEVPAQMWIEGHLPFSRPDWESSCMTQNSPTQSAQEFILDKSQPKFQRFREIRNLSLSSI